MAQEGSVIEVRFGEDLATSSLNRLRTRMELGDWRRRWRDAVEREDYETMDRLDKEFDRVGLP